ncbi:MULTISPECIES: VOC family protein [Streptomyces]|uniref:VOC family protein n=1 Tax=Streptomyces TaxID=1883 RepID=UPI00278C8A67|nr:VOC family protein [Streptomyces hydrogenans]
MPLADYYSAVLEGVDVVDPPETLGTWHLFSEASPPAGILYDEKTKTSYWCPYFVVPDNDAAVAALKAGAESIEPARDESWGKAAELTDPLGNPFGVFSRP